jgi:hypothetical protein
LLRAHALGNFLVIGKWYFLKVVETCFNQNRQTFLYFLQECLGISNKVKMKVLPGHLYHGNFSM